MPALLLQEGWFGSAVQGARYWLVERQAVLGMPPGSCYGVLLSPGVRLNPLN